MFEWSLIKISLIRLALAALCGGLIGMERGRRGSAAGLRTHLLACIGGAMTSLVSLYVLQTTAYTDNVFRISAQVVSGIGFLGAGMILSKGNGSISGLTTAAAMWVTAIIGIAFGFGYYVGAGIAFVLCIVATAVLTRLEHSFKADTSIYIELNDPKASQEVVNKLTDILGHRSAPDVIPARSGSQGHVGLIINTIHNFDSEVAYKQICELEGVDFVLIS